MLRKVKLFVAGASLIFGLSGCVTVQSLEVDSSDSYGQTTYAYPHYYDRAYYLWSS